MFDRHLKVWPDHAPKHVTMPETSLYSNLAISALRYPSKRAIVYYGSEMTYARLEAEVEALAGYLASVGVKRGDRVLLYMQNSPQFIIGFYAIMRANAAVVPVNPMNRTAELAYLVEDTGAQVALAGQEVYPALAPLLQKGTLKNVVVAAYADYVTEPTDLALPDAVKLPRQPVSDAGAVLWSDALAAGLEPPALEVGPDDLCVIPYSSGTTGHPKGCVHTHRTAMVTAVTGAIWTQVPSDAVQLVTVPMFHVTGMQLCMNNSIFSGCTMVVMTRWDRRVAAELIERYKVTNWRNISTMVVDLLSDPATFERDLSSLKAMGGGGAPMPKAVEAKLYETLGLRYIEGYGLSETISTTHANPPQAPKAQCLGIPVMGIDSRVVDVDSLQEVGPNETGEIIINGPNVFQGYWNRPEETEKAFMELDGKRFFRTGDLGYYDEEGYFFIVDRVKRMINASGYKVWPTEVESLMYAHPAIQEVCIISSPDPRRGETVKAMVVLKPDQKGAVDEQAIIDWCRESMAAYKVPHLIEFVDALPKSPTGKVMWRHLQEQEWERAAKNNG